MSVLLKCDKCGKTVTESMAHEVDFNWCALRYIDDDVKGLVEYHLCENCKTEFNAWMFDGKDLFESEFEEEIK